MSHEFIEPIAGPALEHRDPGFLNCFRKASHNRAMLAGAFRWRDVSPLPFSFVSLTVSTLVWR